MKEPVPGENYADRVTLKEVARLAGVSVTTASVVLSDKARERRISDQVVRRVLDVARQHDYAPNLLVRSLRKGRTHVLSFYNAYGRRGMGDLYMDRLVAAVEGAAGDRGYELLSHCDHSRPVDTTYRLLNGGRSDGLLFFGPQYDNPLLARLRRSPLPTVILNREDEEGELSSVADDMHQGVALVADTLLGLGHRRIGAITDAPTPRTPAPMRVEAFRASLAERGVDLRAAVPVYGGGPYDFKDALNLLLAPSDPVTAVFCWNDWCGYKVLEACDALGIGVPDRLSLIGYDGLHFPSTSPHVLTSIAVPLGAIAAEAVDVLERLALGQDAPPVRRVLPVALHPGTTLAPPPPTES